MTCEEARRGAGGLRLPLRVRGGRVARGRPQEAARARQDDVVPNVRRHEGVREEGEVSSSAPTFFRRADLERMSLGELRGVARDHYPGCLVPSLGRSGLVDAILSMQARRLECAPGRGARHGGD